MRRKIDYPDIIFDAIGWATIVGGFTILGTTGGLLVASKIPGAFGIALGCLVFLSLIICGLRVASRPSEEDEGLHFLSKTVRNRNFRKQARDNAA